jgi:hypothetical protein
VVEPRSRVRSQTDGMWVSTDHEPVRQTVCWACSLSSCSGTVRTRCTRVSALSRTPRSSQLRWRTSLQWLPACCPDGRASPGELVVPNCAELFEGWLANPDRVEY